jgi:hypothetical protein
MAQRPDGATYTEALVVEVDGHPLPAHYWQSTGVEWGYQGAGPTALAYDLLVHAFNAPLARNHLGSFADEVIARLLRETTSAPGLHLEWTLTSGEIHDWLRQQGRPERIQVYWSALEWVAQEEGTPRQLVATQFLPDRRLMLELERQEYETRYIPVVRWAVEQELRQNPPQWPVWSYVRDVAAGEYYLFPG